MHVGSARLCDGFVGTDVERRRRKRQGVSAPDVRPLRIWCKIRYHRQYRVCRQLWVYLSDWENSVDSGARVSFSTDDTERGNGPSASAVATTGR